MGVVCWCDVVDVNGGFVMSICVKFGLLCDIVEMFGCYFEVCEILFYVEE